MEKTELTGNNSLTINDYIEYIRAENQNKLLLTGRAPTAFTHTYGCQQNVADTQRLDGFLLEMGYTFAKAPEQADLVLYNTCAIREGAENRVFGNVGALKQAKLENPDMLIGLCGCMTQQEHIAKTIRKSYPFVDFVFGAGAMHRLPEIVYGHLKKNKRVFSLGDPTFDIVEDLPVYREDKLKAWLPIMTGCNNFCTYCIVPYVRGRERSRKPEEIIAEAENLIAQGYKEITLLGQNVNSYGKTLEQPMTFAELLSKVAGLAGDFQVRFMTSHPKDCTKELIDVVAEHSNIVKHLHLPVQSGSNKVLQAMNRQYTVEHYLSLVDYAREKCPNIAITSDIIVGFPGETYEDFKKTLELLEKVQYNSVYTFIFSPREGTRAIELPDPTALAEKKEWFSELLSLQNSISTSYHESMVGKSFKVLLDGHSKQREGYLSGRTYSDVIIECEADEEKLGHFVTIKVTQAQHWAVVGEII